MESAVFPLEYFAYTSTLVNITVKPCNIILILYSITLDNAGRQIHVSKVTPHQRNELCKTFSL